MSKDIRVPLFITIAILVPPVPEWHYVAAFLLGLWGMFVIERL